MSLEYFGDGGVYLKLCVLMPSKLYFSLELLVGDDKDFSPVFQML